MVALLCAQCVENFVGGLSPLRREHLCAACCFKVIQSEGISEHDMYNTFNMGVGLCVAVAADQADEAVRILKENGEEACILGEVREGEKGIDLC